MTIDVEPTAEAIDQMAERLRNAADELASTAKQMRTSKDLTLVAEAMNIVVNAIPNLRLDLLVLRPLRTYQNQEDQAARDSAPRPSAG